MREINYEGDWNSFSQKFDIILNYDRNLYEIETSELEKVATVKTTDLFQFKTKWSDKKKNVGLIVGVTVACVVVVAIIVVMVVIVVRSRKGKVQSSKET